MEHTVDFEHIRIEFLDGRRAWIARLTQDLVYEGLIEGLPTRQMNERYLAGLRERHPGLCLLEAVQTPLEWSDPRPYPFGEPARLPPVRCVAEVRDNASGGIVRRGTSALARNDPPLLARNDPACDRDLSALVTRFGQPVGSRSEGPSMRIV